MHLTSGRLYCRAGWVMRDNKERENKHKWQDTANISQRGGEKKKHNRGGKFIRERREARLQRCKKSKKQCFLQGWETLLSVWMHIYGSLAADVLLQDCCRAAPKNPCLSDSLVALWKRRVRRQVKGLHTRLGNKKLGHAHLNFSTTSNFHFRSEIPPRST